MNIKDIKWPIFAIGSDVTIHTDTNVIYIDHSGTTSIIDNKNLKGDTLGQRRLRIDKDSLYHFKRTIFMFSELIDYTRTKLITDRKFVDSNGNIFNYKKTKVKPLIWKKVLSIEKYNTYVLAKVNDIQYKFEIPNNYWKKFIQEEDIWLGILKLKDFYILYDIDNVYHKDTWRKI